jgi:hypothetical protein
VEVPMFYRMVTPDPTYQASASYSYYQNLEAFNPLTPLETNEMRVTFMGSMIPLPVRRAQAEMSIFVEVGWKADPTDVVYQGRAVDQFVFDCGAGVSANYAAAVVGFRRMDKVFITSTVSVRPRIESRPSTSSARARLGCRILSRAWSMTTG